MEKAEADFVHVYCLQGSHFQTSQPEKLRNLHYVNILNEQLEISGNILLIYIYMLIDFLLCLKLKKKFSSNSCQISVFPKMSNISFKNLYHVQPHYGQNNQLNYMFHYSSKWLLQF